MKLLMVTGGVFLLLQFDIFLKLLLVSTKVEIRGNISESVSNGALQSSTKYSEGNGPHCNGSTFFQVMDQRVKFMLSPESSGECWGRQCFLVTLVMSDPSNFGERMAFREAAEGWRNDTLNEKGVRTLFIIGTPANDSSLLQKRINQEYFQHKDIIQLSMEDTYRSLAYKVVSGLIWVRCFLKSTAFVAKTDDNAEIDHELLFTSLSKQKEVRSSSRAVLCPNIFRNCLPLTVAPENLTLWTSKWSRLDVGLTNKLLPDSCMGWLYVLDGEIVGEVVTVVNALLDIHILNGAEDRLITGFARDRMEEVQVDYIEPSSWLWNKLFSQCPVLCLIKNVFFNYYVKRKGNYIDNISFVFCCFWENVVIIPLQSSPTLLGILPQWVVTICVP